MKRSLRSWLWRVPLDREFDEEIELHIDMRTRELIDQGIENQGDLAASQIPKALTTVVRTNQPAPQSQNQPQTPPPQRRTRPSEPNY